MRRFVSIGVVGIFALAGGACASEDSGNGGVGGAGALGGAAGTAGFGAAAGTAGVGGMAGAAGGGGTAGSGGSGCNDVCTLSGATQCKGDIVQTCKPAANGCLDWSDGVDCAATNQACDATSGTALCVLTCTDMCSTEGQTQCNATTIETCTKGTDGCLDWTAGTDCSTTNQACDATGGTAQCVTTCTDQCTTSGSVQCDGNVIETCATGSSGCLEWTTTADCTQSNQVCDATGGTPACVTPCTNKCIAIALQSCNGSVIQTCQAQSNGCLDWTPGTDCAATSEVCVQTGNNASCVAPNTSGEDCAGAIAIKAGLNTINWTASANNYITSTPSCVSVGTIDGPDVVLSYTPNFTGSVDFSLIDKPTSTRWVAVVSDAACGTLTPQLECASDWSPDVINGSFAVTSGKTYYFYVADTTSGTAPLSNPFKLTLTEIDCSTFAASTSNELPANGATTTTLSPTLSIGFNTAVTKTAGVVSVTGDKGTALSYDLSTSQSGVSFDTAGTTMTITPGTLQPGEKVTVSWSGLKDAKCGNAVPAPTWSFTVVNPPCAPGAGGLVGTTQSTIASGNSSIFEYYVEADDSPTGYVYVGETLALYRMPKSGGALQDVELAAGLTTSNLGYAMEIAGNEVFTVESKTTGTAGHVYRITTDGGSTWNVQDYVTFPTSLADDIRSARAYKGKLYLAVHESTASLGTEIWSVPLGASTVPTTATLETTISNEANCSGLGVDDSFFYLACSTNDRLIRATRTSTPAVTLLTDAIDLSVTANQIHAVDLTSDGVADVLYLKAAYERVHYVCGPGTATPYIDTLLTYDTGASSSYGLGFDPVANALWVYEDTADNFIKIQ